MGGTVVLEDKWPVLGRHGRAAEWLRVWTDLGRAPRTIDAYARGLAEYLLICERDGVDPVSANRLQVAAFVKDLATRPSRRGSNVVALDSGVGLANATLQQRLVPPSTLARAYNDAGYFARNVRTIEVLVDRDAVASGAAASGEPWQYYDLGHGWCTYTFFEQCQHRMACARCDFYTPKNSSRGQLLEAKENLQMMLANIPLTDDERAAVDDGQAALGQLLERLTDVPTPAGPTPRQIGTPATATLLPIVDVTTRPRQCGPGSP